MQTTIATHSPMPLREPTPSGSNGASRSRPPAPRPDSPGRDLWVEPWMDLCPGVEPGHHPLSPYVERFWLAVLGPTSTWLIRRLAMRLDEAPDGATINTAEIAYEMGLISRRRLQQAFDRAFHRCYRFGLIQRGRHDTLFVRMRLPHLNSHLVERLPPSLRLLHDTWPHPEPEDPKVAKPATDDTLNRARHLAMALLACGDGGDSVEQQLHSWQFHPAVAFEAARWAIQRHTTARAAAAEANAGTDAKVGAGQ